MSNHKSVANTDHRKPKVSLAMTIIQGLGGSNPFAEKRMRDVQPVNIPALQFIFEEVTQLVRLEELLDFPTSA